MSAGRIEVVFYHSVICPRCHFTGLMLRNALRKHPDVELTKVEFLTNTRQARDDGIRSIPSLVAQGRSLSGFVLTQGRIERFLASLTPASA
jgi:hypothetical protein